MGVDPVSLGIVSGIISLASTAVGTLASVQQSKFQASVARMNAQIEEDNARRATERAMIDAQTQDRINAGIFGEQIAAQGSSGLSARSGSFALSRKSARTLGRFDTANVVQEGLLEAFNNRVSAANFRSEASAAKAAGRSALVGGVLSGIGGVADIASTPTSSGRTLLQTFVGRSTAPPRRFAGPRQFSFKG